MFGEVFMFEEFDASVLDIVGLTDYHPQTLPDWLRSRLDEMFGALGDNPTDRELVRRHIDEGRGWLAGWGTAKIGDEQVLICQSDGIDCECFEAVYIAELIHCGLVFVEPSDRFDADTTLYFTEDRCWAKRMGSYGGVETRGACSSDSWSAPSDDMSRACLRVSD